MTVRIIRKYNFIFALGLFMLFTSFFWNRPFPKRLLGNYHGQVDSYAINVSQEKIKIPETEQKIKLSYDNLILTTSNQTKKIRYDVKNKTKHYYSLTVFLEDGSIENWKLYRKRSNQKIIRSAQAPRPEVIFLKN